MYVRSLLDDVITGIGPHSGLFIYISGQMYDTTTPIPSNFLEYSVLLNSLITAGDAVNTVKYWDVEKGGYRSLRYENLVQVF